GRLQRLQRVGPGGLEFDRLALGVGQGRRLGTGGVELPIEVENSPQVPTQVQAARQVERLTRELGLKRPEALAGFRPGAAELGQQPECGSPLAKNLLGGELSGGSILWRVVRVLLRLKVTAGSRRQPQ